jgi:hypothetical protein
MTYHAKTHECSPSLNVQYSQNIGLEMFTFFFLFPIKFNISNLNLLNFNDYYQVLFKIEVTMTHICHWYRFEINKINWSIIEIIIVYSYVLTLVMIILQLLLWSTKTRLHYNISFPRKPSAFSNLANLCW